MYHNHHYQTSKQGHVMLFKMSWKCDLPNSVGTDSHNLLYDFCVIIGKICVYVSDLNIYIKWLSYNQFKFSNVVANENVIFFLS